MTSRLEIARATRRWLTASHPHRKPIWRIAFIVGAVAFLISLLVNAFTSELRPGNLWGLGYGVGALVLLLLAGAYPARRRMPRLGPGSAHAWLQLHIYGGALFLLLLLAHSAFRLPHGWLGWGLWLGGIWTAAAGLWGLTVQKWVPRMLTSGLSIEANYARIPALVESIRVKAEGLVESSSDTVQKAYQKEWSDLLSRPRARLIYLMDVSGGLRHHLKSFDHFRRFLAADDRSKWDELRELLQAKFELDAHFTLQRLLRWWLYLHVPVSVILLVLVGFHVFSVLYY